MLLSAQQKFILSLLREFRCLRKRQLYAFVRDRFCQPHLDITEERLEVMLRQLRACVGDVRMDGDLVFFGKTLPDAMQLEAVDVMLELCGGAPKEYSTQVRRPFLLRFVFGDTQVKTFTVVPASELASLSEYFRQVTERFIWLSGPLTYPKEIVLPPKSYLAVRQADGTHRFYGSEEP